MAIIVKTDRPKTLLRAIYQAIDRGTVVTWSHDSDGDFTHDVTQWRDRAWLSPRPEAGSLRLVIIPPRDKRLSSATYAVYHGRFAEMLLAHFDDYFTTVRVTAMPAIGDKV